MGKKRKRVQEFRPEMTEKLEKALSHPLRATILARLNDAPATASQVAKEIGEPRNTVNYHFSVLDDLECIELVEEQPVRGTFAKVYRGIMKVLLDYEDWEKLSLRTRLGISLKAFGQAFELAQQALASGTFEKRLDRVIANHRLKLDDSDWGRAVQILRRASTELEDLKEESVANPSSQSFWFSFSLLGYESPSPSEPNQLR